MDNSSGIRSRPKISVIVPSKDNSSSLARCINSLQYQTYHEYEIIVVFAGPGYDSIRLASDTLHISFLQDTRKTRGGARNLGSRFAKGDLLVCTDDDCEYPKEWLTKIFDESLREPNVAAFGGTDVTPTQSSIWGMLIGLFEEHKRESPAHGKQAATKMKTCNTVYRRDAFKNAGGFDETIHFGEDFELNIRLAQEGHQLRFDPDICVWHHRRNSLWDVLKHNYHASKYSAKLRLSIRFIEYWKYDFTFFSSYLALISPWLALFLFLAGIPLLWLGSMFTFVIIMYSAYILRHIHTKYLSLFLAMPPFLTLTILTTCLGLHAYLLNILSHILISE